MTWGYHLIANLKKCTGYPNIFSGKKFLKYAEKDLDNIVKIIIKSIDVKPYGPIIVNHFGVNSEIAGISMYQLIETSNISAHIVDKNKNVYFDVFSCKEYDPELVKNILIKEFRPLTCDFKFIERV